MLPPWAKPTQVIRAMTGHLGDEGVGSVTVIKEECDSCAFLDLKPFCDQSIMPTPDPCGDDSKRSQNFVAVIPGYYEGALTFFGRFF